MTPLCMYRSGGEFNQNHVLRLAEMVPSIVCLTDDPVPGMQCVRMKHDWPKWWGKIELFNLFRGDFVYFDLDTTVRALPECGDSFTMLPNVYRDGDYGSGVMAWRGDYSYLYDAFSADPKRYMAEYVTTPKWGDQGFIRDHLKEKPSVFGADCRSYKVHGDHGEPVIYFHGKPRPWDV